MITAIEIITKLEALSEIAQCDHISFRFDGTALIVHFSWKDNYNLTRGITPASAAQANYDVLTSIAREARHAYEQVHDNAELDTRP